METRYYSKFQIDKISGRMKIPMQDIKKGCLLNAKKSIIKSYSTEGVFLTKEEALEAFKKYVSSFKSYSRSVHHITEYELMEVVYEVIDDEEEYPSDYITIATSEFQHYQLWAVKNDGTRRFVCLVTLDMKLPFNVDYRDDEIGAVWTNLDGKVIKEFKR